MGKSVKRKEIARGRQNLRIGGLAAQKLGVKWLGWTDLRARIIEVRPDLAMYGKREIAHQFLTDEEKAGVLHRPGRKKRKENNAFYESREWMALRYLVLKQYGRRCMVCGASGARTSIHVDHIKPRSKYPELELDRSNLQVLCRACNIGKSNIDETDWRPDEIIH